DGRPQPDGAVELRIGAGAVGADRDQVPVAVVARDDLAELVGGGQVLRRYDPAHGAAHRRFDVDRRIDAGLGDGSRQHDVAVENGPGGVDDRIVLVVAFGQYGIEGRDRAAASGARAGALDELRQPGEH